MPPVKKRLGTFEFTTTLLLNSNLYKEKATNIHVVFFGLKLPLYTIHALFKFNGSFMAEKKPSETVGPLFAD